MNKQDFLDSYLKYGIKEENVCFSRIGVKGCDLEDICVIAPLHKVEAYTQFGAKVTKLSFGYYPCYKVEYKNKTFNFITTQIGAPNADEIVVALAFSNCKKIIFTGSCGGLETKFNIGDILLPEFSISGDGATMYYTKGEIKDNFTFGKKFYPTKDLNEKLIEYFNEINLDYSFVGNISIDTIVGQFFHIDEFRKMGAEVVEMETASVFCLAEMLDMEAVAILNISDSTASSKSLLAGRTKEELELHVKTENYTVPKLVLGFIEKL